MSGGTVGNEAFVSIPGEPQVVRAPATTAVNVRRGIGIAGLLALHDDWIALAATLPEGRFHQAYGWMLSNLRHLEESAAAVHFIAFYRSEQAIAIFSLRRTRRSVNGIPLWLWELPFHPHTSLCDCLIDPREDTSVVMRLLIETLSQARDLPWDAIHFPNLLDDAHVLRALRGSGLPRSISVNTGQSMYFACTDIAAAMGNCSGSFKRNLRRQRRKLDQRGQVEVSLIRHPEELAQAFSAFLELEASGWKGKDGRNSAILLHRNLLRFYREVMTDFATDRRCLISLLRLDGTVIAAQYCLLAGTTLYLLKIAYDEKLSAEAPGSQLLYDVLQHCCNSPDITHLSLVTAPDWARGRWVPETQDIWRAYVFNRSLSGITAYAAGRMRSSLAAVAKSPLVGKILRRTDAATAEVSQDVH